MFTVRQSVMLVAVGLLAVSLVPAIPAAPAEIISDRTGDQSFNGNSPPADAAEWDITSVSGEYLAGEETVELSVTVDGTLDQAGMAKVFMGRAGWLVSFTAPSSGSTWEVLATPSATLDGVNTRWCVDGGQENPQGFSASTDGSTITWSMPLATGQNNFTGMITDISAQSYHDFQQDDSSPSPNPADCGVEFSTVDRAPDSGVADRFITDGDVAFSLSADQADVGVEAGGSASYTVTVENTGGLSGDATFAATNADGWDAAVDPASASLDGGETVDVTVDVTAPDDVSSGTTSTTTFEVLANNETKASLDLNATVGGGGGGVLQISADETSVEADPGSAVEYELTIANSGSSDLDLSVSVDGDEGWASVDPGELTVAAGEEGTVEVSVDVPSDASSGSVTHTVSVESDADASASIDLTTVVAGGDDAGTSEDDETGGASTPGFEAVAVIAAAAAMAVLFKRRDRR